MTPIRSQAQSATAPIHWEGLPEGRLLVQLLRGQDTVDQREVMLSRQVPGVLELRFPEAASQIPRSAITGLIELPSGMDLDAWVEALQVRIYAIEDGVSTLHPLVVLARQDLVDDPQSPTRFYFLTPELPLGPKYIELRPLGRHITLDLGIEGGFAEFLIPELGLSHLNFVDENGMPIDIKPRLVTSMNSERITPLLCQQSSDGRGLDLVCSPGEIRLATGQPGWSPSTLTAYVPAGENTLTFRLQSNYRFGVSFLQEGQELELPASWWMDLNLEAIEPGRELLGLELAYDSSSNVRVMQCVVSGPGAYRIEIPAAKPNQTSTFREVLVHDPRNHLFQLEL